jgi:mannose-6-phosphate isomerase-like protein (cupin superfamily)
MAVLNRRSLIRADHDSPTRPYAGTETNSLVMKDTSVEVVGYVIKGKAELHLEGQTLILNAGDSYAVPKNASHTYKILESFTAVEATSPPAMVHQL